MRNLTKTAVKINAKIGKAIHDYGLIEDKDSILVAVSGGKDSLTLLSLLTAIREWAPVTFEIKVVHIKTDFHCASCVHDEVLIELFKKYQVEYIFRDIKVLDEKKETNCFWCSWNKRKAFFEIAEEQSCNKIALGHHKDDIVETTLMNLFCKGEISTMNPRQEMFRGELTLIRPLCYVDEELIKQYAKESAFPSQLCKCPFGKDSKRQYMKDLIEKIRADIPGSDVKTNIFRSLSRIKQEYVGLIQEDDREDKA